MQGNIRIYNGMNLCLHDQEFESRAEHNRIMAFFYEKCGKDNHAVITIR